MIQFQVLGEPVAQQRHRDRRKGGKFDPCAKQKEAFLVQALVDSGICSPLDGPLFMFIHCWVSRPKSDPDRKFAIHGNHPDVDNYAKFVMDALNKCFYKDDSQIVSLTVIKEFDNSNPRTDIIISEFKPRPFSLSGGDHAKPE